MIRLYLALFGLAALALRAMAMVGVEVGIRSALANYICRGVTPAAITFTSFTGKMRLHTADPGAAGTTSEVTGGSYAAQAALYNAASSGVCSLSADVPFAGMPAVTVTHLSMWNTANTTFMFSVALTASQTIGTAGATMTVTAAGTSVTF